jgi:NTE family protein
LNVLLLAHRHPMEPSTQPAGAPPQRRTLGLALGGGGARGLAHVGILKALDEAGVKPDVIAGTSMGGLIGGAYAAGFSGKAIEREVLALASASRLIQFADRIPTLRAIFSGRRFETYLAHTIGADLTFADLRRPLAVSTVDLNTGREVVFRSGAVVPALRATISIPGVFAAVERGGRRLIDGGILNNVPADHARSLGADVVMAVDVLPCFIRPDESSPLAAPQAASPMELPLAPAGVRDIWEAVFISVAALTSANLENSRPDMVVRPELPTSITLLTGYMRAEESIEAGERAMQGAMAELKDLLIHKR